MKKPKCAEGARQVGRRSSFVDSSGGVVRAQQFVTNFEIPKRKAKRKARGRGKS